LIEYERWFTLGWVTLSSPDPAEDALGPAERPIEPPWWRAPRPSRRRAPLTREQIVGAALRIVDHEGADALTVRRLGEELNTGSATLYWYISGKDELGELAYDDVMGAITLAPPDPAHWEDQFKDLGRQAYRLLVAHNDLVRLALGRVPAGPNMLRVMEWLLALLRAAGLPDHAVRYAGATLARYVDVSVLGHVASRGGPAEELVGGHFAGLPRDRFPNLAALPPPSRNEDARFEFGLELIARGLASLLEHGGEARDA